MLLKEIAVENFTDIPKLIRAGANRIELNDNLAVGGTTVSHGVLAESARYTQEHQVGLVAMIRPRGGNFIYNDLELKMMETDLFTAQSLGVDAVTFGALRQDHTLDTEAMEMLIGAASGMTVVMHMAFDQIPKDQQVQTLTWLADHQVQRVLSHGDPDLQTPITANLAQLKTLISASQDLDLTILPGGGITADNADEIAAQLGVKALHGTKLIRL
ncbi:copper resistance protein [Agrilactobacillus composti DSM 18527 = JCM 14202]|uniref:PF03932 family protein CutC n=1 Tax=Agrilactobacillus composti DSM 18527 = JCM 14202 TaxID=1423734 RepID=X0PE36_9LACO|nr:copper homeostasis protein CutC [Agrilactobacillus composti]KRM31116.1 copper resistance protein [Agrilactobacillus composti DSM 18527 = JCM 14202]GAF39498.1 cytoplasmic copper homeostasis protein CutC [Agrilactobacillus composti DSM 18527 = JCM 14202]